MYCTYLCKIYLWVNSSLIWIVDWRIIKFFWIIKDIFPFENTIGSDYQENILKTLWINFKKILRKPREHLKNIWRTSKNICELLKTSLSIWTHLDQIWKCLLNICQQLRASWAHLKTTKTSIEHLRTSEIILRTTENPS